MKKILLIILAIVGICGVGFLIWWNLREPPIPSDMEPATDVRAAVKGKTVDDISKITIEIIWPDVHPIVVTKKANVKELLAGLQQAIRPKTRYADAGPRISIYWKGNKQPSFFLYACVVQSMHLGRSSAEPITRSCGIRKIR